MSFLRDLLSFILKLKCKDHKHYDRAADGDRVFKALVEVGVATADAAQQ